MVAFYWTVIAYIFLVFDYINYTFPNPLSYYPADPYQSGISFEMASLIVMLPLFMFLMRFIRKDIAVDPSRKEIWVRRWLLILTLFVAGIAMAGDFIALLTTFLNGEEMTIAFLLKVLVIFLVAAGVFMHFSADLRGYWDTWPMRKRYVSIGVGVLAAMTIVAGFFIVGTPAEARLARFDAQKVIDLQTIQSQVLSYYQAKQKLPAALADINTSLAYGPLPVDVQTGREYVYQMTGTLTFKLCADFNGASRNLQQVGDLGVYTVPITVTPIGATKGMAQDNWQHESGIVCFDRTIDPSFYPPLK